MMKLLVNQVIEQMGLSTTQLVGTLLDGAARHTPEGTDFSQRALRGRPRRPCASATRRSATTARGRGRRERAARAPCSRAGAGRGSGGAQGDGGGAAAGRCSPGRSTRCARPSTTSSSSPRSRRRCRRATCPSGATSRRTSTRATASSRALRGARRPAGRRRAGRHAARARRRCSRRCSTSIEDGAPAAMPRGRRPHPPALRRLRARGAARPRGAPTTTSRSRRRSSALGAATLSADAAADRLLNVNTPADLEVAELLLSRRWRDIVRAGCTKPGSLTWCLSSLRQTASRTICSRSSSVAPARSGPRRSVSLRRTGRCAACRRRSGGCGCSRRRTARRPG